ncbi:MAG: long-chain fatty acid--CoA ligase, partial [Actinobacteria bacterium ATB1]|nr:long-chain fatty acid--CoA ligase [Actinobacteria bacterium ATB1]
YIIDRLKDMIVSKAENVYPAEVEHVLAEHPDIADVTVIGVPDEEYGEAVCAVVVPAGDTCPSADSLREWARDKLASYKLPRRVEVVEELPRNPSGKVLRREVRAPFWAGRERQVN